MAENRPAVSGLHSVQVASVKYCRWFNESNTEVSHSTALVRQRAFMSYKRIWALVALGTSSLAVAAPQRLNSMFDWPEQSHTSPANTLLYCNSLFGVKIFKI